MEAVLGSFASSNDTYRHGIVCLNVHERRCALYSPQALFRRGYAIASPARRRFRCCIYIILYGRVINIDRRRRRRDGASCRRSRPTKVPGAGCYNKATIYS
jgi:hypothetical protein